MMNSISHNGAVNYNSLTSTMNSGLLERRKEVQFGCCGFGGVFLFCLVFNITFALHKSDLKLKV